MTIPLRNRIRLTILLFNHHLDAVSINHSPPPNNNALDDFEPLIRIGSFIGVFVVMSVWELLAPRRPRSETRLRRWPGNLGIVVIDTVLLRLLFPAAAVGTAYYASSNSWGIFSLLHLPWLVSVIASVLILDLAIYFQHRLFHIVPVFWRLHRMHHADLDFDVTTGIRFHPIEIILSMLIKFGVIIIIGVPVVAVVIFEILLNATSLFNHSNAYIAPRIDRVLRWFVVTPDMHRVHHSIITTETNSNFGFNIPWWDRLFGTYQDQPRAGHDGITIGLEIFRDPNELRLDKMLLQPFRNAI